MKKAGKDELIVPDFLLSSSNLAALLNLRGSMDPYQQPPLTSPTELSNLPLSIHLSEGGIMHVSITYCVQ